MVPVFLLFIPGGIALIISLHLFQQASRQRRQGVPFVKKAGYAFLSLLLSVALFLACLFYFAHLLQGKIGG